MKVFAVSDIHIDYQVNAEWISQLSTVDYRDDILILAGDISDSLDLIAWCFKQLASRFRKVHFVPGNHDLWVIRDRDDKTSFDKFHEIRAIARDCGISICSEHYEGLSVVPLLGWYDYSFGAPGDEFKSTWMDFRACRWGDDAMTMQEVTAAFLRMNRLNVRPGNAVISFSHFLPRIDLMPSYIPQKFQSLYPVLGTSLLEKQIREVKAAIHVYGHSHVNRRLQLEGVWYINNAFGYPSETRISAKRLVSVYDTGCVDGREDKDGRWRRDAAAWC